MKKWQIYKIYGTDYTEMTKELLKRAKLKKRIPHKNCRIGIKPNLISPTEACRGATTHPEIVAGIIEYLQERGFFNLVMLEGSWIGARTSEAVKVCGYESLSQRYGVPFIDTQQDEAVRCDCAGMPIEICRSAREVEFLINVPVLKGHCQTNMTCALKNLKGLIPNSEKSRFHILGLHEPIAHLAAGLPQHFIVVDHICGDLEFEEGGNPVTTNCIMAARDPVFCDAYGCRLLGFRKKDVPYIGIAESLGVGASRLKKEAILELEWNSAGEKKKQPKEKLSGKQRKKEELKNLKTLVQESKACSACYSNLMNALMRLEQEGMTRNIEKGSICIGQGFRKKTGKLGVGSCTKNFDRCQKGCPPSAEKIYSFLKKEYQKV